MSENKDLEKLLELRKKLKSKKPEFLRHLWWKKPKFRNDPKWRKPKGTDNKMRLKKKGYPPLVEVGYRGPKLVRGLHPSGLKPVVIHDPKELDRLDPNMHILYIGRTVGLRKRIEIMRIASEKGFKVANQISLSQKQ
ncbi:LSU ribosomal protein L32E [Staphylothermus marinus F1]|uniref:Large ribosomal subunit protein eL32 n=1 Tax=Staphylothermus marinus (strain ATCC 43588 / DSM 3639 / JCM 9404 / F1) TaxID=399550 RepID=A3DNC4_STAMF|nr:50S ribosomal protein L32e [Staphylothermus marinus]ABN70134.1 LSU ribosomal protein L32E [Staphylothermus marinus F1]